MTSFFLLKTLLIFTIALISGSLFSVTSLLGSTEEVNWKVFNDSNGLFTIQYPSKWMPMNVSDPLGPIDVQFRYDGTDESYGWVGVYAAPDSTYSTSLEMIKDEQVRAQSADVDIKLKQAIECSKYLINDVQACSMIYSDVDFGLMGKVLFVYAVDDKGIEYALYLGASDDLFEYFKPVFDHMVNSFALKGIR